MAGHAKTLNPRQALFATAVANGIPAVQAARDAGYKDGPNLSRIATQVAQQPLVKAEINRLLDQSRATRELTAERWRSALMDEYLGSHADSDRANSLRALELWGKHLGLLDAKRDDNSTRAAEVLATLAQLMRPQPDANRTVEAWLLPDLPHQ